MAAGILDGAMKRYDAAVILAGGASRRMGSEKAILDAGGETLLERQARQLAAAFDCIGVSVAHGGPSPGLAGAIERARSSAGRELFIVCDKLAGQGPLAGVSAALEGLPPPAERAFFLAVDAPQLDLDLVAALWAASLEPGALGAVPRWSGGLEPAYAVYARALRDQASGLLARRERSLQSLARTPGVALLDLEARDARERVFGKRVVDLAALFGSLNTPAELEAWKARRR